MKIFIAFFFFITTIIANDLELESSIFNTIIQAITSKSNPKVYIHTEVESLEKNPKNLQIIQLCKDSDIVVLSTLKNIPQACDGKIFFGTRYGHLKNPDVIGAFFWQKGRPNILFYKSRLNMYGIKLDENFGKYIENDK